jgi:hypothetical protein
MTGLRFRAAGPEDAYAVAALHASSWQRHYRGAFSDAFLDDDVAGYLLPLWTERLTSPDPRVALTEREIADWSPSSGLYLWVLEQNTAAQAFYAARGGTCGARGNPAARRGARQAQRQADGLEIRMAGPVRARRLTPASTFRSAANGRSTVLVIPARSSVRAQLAV